MNVICDAEGIVLYQTPPAARADGEPPAATAWTRVDAAVAEAGVHLVKCYWFDHLDCDAKELQQVLRRAGGGAADRVRVWVRVDEHQLIRAELTATPLVDATGAARHIWITTEPTRAGPRRRDGAAGVETKAVRTAEVADAPAAAPVDLVALAWPVPLVRLELATGTVTGANDAFAALIGRAASECANVPLSEFVRPSDRRALSQAFNGRAATHDRAVDAALVTANGDAVPARWSPATDPSSTPDRATLLLVVRDRVADERADALAREGQTLADAAGRDARRLARLDKLIDQAPVGLALFHNGHAVRTNAAFDREAGESAGWIDALANRTAKSRATAEQHSTRQSMTSFWIAEDASADGAASDDALVGATIAAAPPPALALERDLAATTRAMEQSARVAVAVVDADDALRPIGDALAAMVGTVPATIDALVDESSLGELRTALAHVQSSRSTFATRLSLRGRGVCEATFAACDGSDASLVLFEDASESAAQVDALRAQLVEQHETVEQLRIAAAATEAAEAGSLRARAAEQLAQLRRLFEALAGGVVSWDIDEGHVDADPRSRALLGCDADAALTPATLLAAAEPDDRQRFERALFDAMSPGSTGTLDVVARCGKPPRRVRIVGSVLFERRDATGEPAGEAAVDDTPDPTRFVGGTIDLSGEHVAEAHAAELNALLKLRTAELNAIFECAPDAVRISTRGTIRHNDAATTLYGERIDALFGAPDGDAPPAAALAGRPSTATVAVAAPGGGERLVQSSAAPVVSDGEVVGAVSIDRDVTEVRHLEAELGERDREISGLFQNTGVGLAYLDVAGVMLDVNPQLSVLLGHSHNDLVGRSLGELAVESDRATLAGQVVAVLTGELMSCSAELRLSRRGGEPCWVQLTIAPRRVGGERSVVALVQDLNELRLERARRADADAALAAMRDRYDLLASTIGEGFVLLDGDGAIVEANAAARRLLALPTGGGGAFEHLAFESPETGSAVTSRLPWSRAARGKATTSELRVRRREEPTAAPLTIEFVASPAADRHVAVNVRDVTTRHALHDDLQKAYARVVEAHTLLQQRTQHWEGNFVSAVQQLGAAVAAAAPIAKSIAADARMTGEARAAAQRLTDAFRVHERLVRHYTEAAGATVAAATAGGAAVTRGDVDVQALAEDALRLLAARFNVSGRLVTTFAATTRVCRVDAALVRHALWSVFAHAASQASRSAARVEASDALGAVGEARLRITVTWPGKSAGTAELALARSLVESEGGTIGVETSGSTTVATVEFDASAGPAAAAAAAPAAAAPPQVRVLLVEDHDSTARVLTRQLTRLRCEVTLAGTLAEAEATLARGDVDVDLIVCDLTMPDGDAPEFVARANAARAAARLAAIPAIALRGYGGDHDNRALRAAGFVDQLVKPVDLSALAAAIGKIGGRRVAFTRSGDVIA